MRAPPKWLIVALFVTCGLRSLAEAGVCPCDADVNNDGFVNVIDSACVQTCTAGDCSCCVDSCDINCDGVVDAADAGPDPLNEISAWRCQFIGFPASSCCGACCDESTGDCGDDLWQSDCTTGGGTWIEALRCADVNCNALPAGACCDLVAETCVNDVVQGDCTGVNATWSEGQSCSPALCPLPPTGACCHSTLGTCDNGVVEASCAGADDVWTEAQSCSPALCPTPEPGACCNLASGICTNNVLPGNCTGASRVWTEATACAQVGCAVPPQEPCPCDGEVNGAAPLNILDVVAVAECARDNCDDCVGSCDVDCSGLVDFVDMGIAVCQFRGKQNCCDEPVGACVGGQGLPACAATTPDGCDLFSGSYRGDGTLCTIGGGATPAASTWGLTILALLIATAATVVTLSRRRSETAV